MAYKQAQNRNVKLAKIYNQMNTKRYNTNGGVYFDEDNCRYIRYYSPDYAKSVRRRGNKKIRKVLDIGNGGAYRKCYEYEYEIT